MTRAIGRSFAIATDTAGGAKAACCTQDASIAADRPSCCAVRMYTPLGILPSGLPIWCLSASGVGASELDLVRRVVADARRPCYVGTVSDPPPPQSQPPWPPPPQHSPSDPVDDVF